MTDRPKRACMYLRVSTDEQTTENQKLQLITEAQRRGWTITQEYQDHGISGAKKRDQRPSLDQMLKDAIKGRFDVVMCVALDRLGRSLSDLIHTLQDLTDAHVDLFILNQAIDTTTAGGKLLFHILGAIAEFERELIRTRTNAGVARARAQGKKLGRPRTSQKIIHAIALELELGTGILSTAQKFGVGASLVQRVKKERMTAQ